MCLDVPFSVYACTLCIFPSSAFRVFICHGNVQVEMIIWIYIYSCVSMCLCKVPVVLGMCCGDEGQILCSGRVKAKDTIVMCMFFFHHCNYYPKVRRPVLPLLYCRL